MVRGKQIMYIPPHAKGDIGHPDVELGFVMDSGPASTFCRFFNKGTQELRTTSCSENCLNQHIRRYDHMSQDVVDALVRGL